MKEGVKRHIHYAIMISNTNRQDTILFLDQLHTRFLAKLSYVPLRVTIPAKLETAAISAQEPLYKK